jgi:NitT/TauT family transport system substrate-binding protein
MLTTRLGRQLSAWRPSLAVAAMAVLFAACGGAAPARSATTSPSVASTAPSSAASTPGKAAAAKRFTFAYTAPAAAFTSLWVAGEENIFAKYGIQADVKNMDSNVVTAALVSGDVHFSTTPALINAILSGSDVIFFARLTRGPIFSVYAAKGITRVEDLKGKVVADTLVGSAPDNAINDILERHGMKPSDVQLIHTPNAVAEFAALQSGQAVAAILPVPTTLQARNAGFVEITTTTKEGTPGITASLGTKKSRLKDDPATIRDVINVFKEATAFMKSNPDRTKEILGKYTKTDPGPDLDETYVSYEPNWEVGPVRAADVAASLRFLPDPRAAGADPNTFFDNSIIESMR